MNLSFIPGVGTVTSVAVNSSYVFWTNSTSNAIGRANLDGTAVQQALISGQQLAYVTADDAHLYISNTPSGSDSRVSVATLDGTVTTPALITEANSVGVYQLAVNPQYLFRFRSQSGSVNSLGRTGLDGAGDSVTTLPGGYALSGVAVSVDHVYTLPAMTGATTGYPLQAAGLGAADLSTLVAGDGRRRVGVAVAGCRLFWTAQAGGSPALPAAIGTATTDSANVVASLVAGVATPGPIAANLLPAAASGCSSMPPPATTPVVSPPITTPPLPMPPTTVGPVVTHYHYTQAELDEISTIFLGFVIPNATLDSIMAATAYQLPPFGGGALDLGFVACVQRCLGGGAAARREGAGLTAVKLPSNAIATATIPAGTGAELTGPELKAKVLAATTLLRVYGTASAKTLALSGKHTKAAGAQRKALVPAQIKTVAALKKLGVTPVHLKITSAGRKALV